MEPSPPLQIVRVKPSFCTFLCFLFVFDFPLSIPALLLYLRLFFVSLSPTALHLVISDRSMPRDCRPPYASPSPQGCLLLSHALHLFSRPLPYFAQPASCAFSLVLDRGLLSSRTTSELTERLPPASHFTTSRCGEDGMSTQGEFEGWS